MGPRLTRTCLSGPVRFAVRSGSHKTHCFVKLTQKITKMSLNPFFLLWSPTSFPANFPTSHCSPPVASLKLRKFVSPSCKLFSRNFCIVGFVLTRSTRPILWELEKTEKRRFHIFEKSLFDKREKTCSFFTSFYV